MFLDPYVSQTCESVQIGAEQASRFAKEVAGDFNPIHDPDNRRFCVPGDLLFALVLARYGMSAGMAFDFTGMLDDGVPLLLADSDAAAFDLRDSAGRSYLHVERHGVQSRDAALIERFVREYVAFSGRNFPHVLAPLMAEHGVMVNPERPLVIYQRMAFELRGLELQRPELELTAAELEVNGRRGDVRLNFRIHQAGEELGSGYKALALSGLREYDASTMARLVAEYQERVAAYQASAADARPVQ